MTAAITAAALQVRERVRSLGRCPREVSAFGGSPASRSLSKELKLLCDNAVTQGWTVRTNNETTLRLRSRRGTNFTLVKGRPDSTREELRLFVKELRAAGLRVNSSLRRPVEQSPL